MGVGNSGEKMQDRINEMLSERSTLESRLRYVPLSDPSLRNIPKTTIYAAIALSGGEAYLEDIKSILENEFGHKIKYDKDLDNLLDVMYGIEWDMDDSNDRVFYKLDRNVYKALRDQIEREMRVALGYTEKSEAISQSDDVEADE